MSDLKMTTAEREAFLADLHVGVLAVARDGKGPLAVPVWYDVEGGDVVISMDGDSVKAKLLRAAGRATVTVQSETPPYKYVMVEGPVQMVTGEHDIYPMAARYLGPEIGRQYADSTPTTADSVVVRLTPQTWFTSDYGKVTAG